MNYLIDHHGQTANAWKAAAVQLTIWRMRENFRSGNTALDRKIHVLEGSARGQRLIAESDRLYADAKSKAKPPAAPKPVTRTLRVAPDPSGAAGRYRVAYPKGTTALSVTGGVFVRNGVESISVPRGEASARYVQVKAGARHISVTGTWASQGGRGWEPALEVHDTATASGASGQRIAVAVGSSSGPDTTGRFKAARHDVPPPSAPPRVASQAQPSATVGGTMTDSVIVSQAPDTTVEMWPEAVTDFTAYLEPEVGAQKYDERWQPVLGDEYLAQAAEPETGALLWNEWWGNSRGEALLDGTGSRIPVADDTGAPTSGVSADGTDYPVVALDGNGRPEIDDAGNPVLLTGRDPVMEERRDPVTWSEVELAGLSTEERCLAQPVFHGGKVPVNQPGTFTSPEVPVHSGGTIHWVERVVSSGKTVHEGRCGLANETTKIDQPAVVTRALPDAVIGDELYDVAIISGKLAEKAQYSVRFEAYRGPDRSGGHVPVADSDGTLSEDSHGDPSCTAENIVFRSEPIAVTGLGEVRSPSFTARPEHGATIWWVETLSLETPDGPRTLHRGACGIEHETTTVAQPEIETRAIESAPVGAMISDVAVVSGGLAANAGASWEVSFDGYRAHTGDGQPTCSDENRLFGTPAVPVTGPGEVASPNVLAESDWVGAVWWVETLWLTQGDARTAIHTGACGIATETTRITAPEVTTDATSFAAIGDVISDTATVTGDLADRAGVEHRIVFRGYRGDASATGTAAATCTEESLLFTLDPVQVTEAGSVKSPEVTALPEYGDTIWWVETLSQWEGDTERELHRGECGLPGETTTVQFPTVRTESAGSVQVGQPMFDTAIVGGKLSERRDVEFRVRFTAYARDAGGALTCASDTELRELSDSGGIRVNGPGKYQSRSVTTRGAHVGFGGYVETLVMIENTNEHVIAVGKCGAPSENFEIRPASAVALAATGTGSASLWLLGAGALVIGCSAVCFGAARRLRRPRAARERGDLAVGRP
ncbi:hypothetical protein ACFWHR_06985 [Leucobacter sp. NPDC058333]|uniref:hypothetical protein n=1 Tax=Leucobacter sp. NPDC058333 TaxID=3346450 RepID=UPI00364EE9BC